MHLSYRNIVCDLFLSIANHIVNRIPSNTVRCFIYRNLYGMKIKKSAHLARGLKVFSSWRIEIGQNTIINSGCTLDGRAGLVIGANVIYRGMLSC